MAESAPLLGVKAALSRQAGRTAVHIVKQRARIYARRPFLMDTLFPSLSAASPATLIAVAAHLIEQDRNDPRRWFVHGGETHAINLHALLILGRTLRRLER